MFGHAKDTAECDELQSWQTGLVRHITDNGAVRVELDDTKQTVVPYHHIYGIVAGYLPDGERPQTPRQ